LNGESEDIYNDKQYYGIGKSKFMPILQNIRNGLSNIRAKRYLAMIPKPVKQPRVLDIGCAEGRLLKSLLQYGCDCYGVEHKSYPHERFLESDRITYFSGDIASFELEQESFDIIMMWHVLEHVDFPDRVINIINRLPKPDGLFIVAVPNFSCAESRIFKEHWFHLDVPWHKYHFSEISLKYLFSKNTIETLSCATFCMEQGPYGLLQSILNSLGFQKNSLYEAIKGNYSCCRPLSLISQLLITIIFIIPCFLVAFLTSMEGKGSSLHFVLKKGEK
jgi:2-polyprenyl-3-methyl-5-hydroxy-6-metoxy-1,4-benzoquinol methylase